MEKKTIGKFISALRRAQGLTQKELGDMLYVSDKTVSRWERDECTPDLSLLPALADIFGITVDELLRGERNRITTDVSADPNEAMQRESNLQKRSDKQWHSMLHRRMNHYKSFSYISVGLGFLALIGAIIANNGFTHGLVGFCIAAVFVLAGVICQLCFAGNAYMSTDDEDDSSKLDALHKHNHIITMCCVKIFCFMFCMLCFCLPISPYVYYGLTFGFWLWQGGLCVILALLLFWVVYSFAMRPYLVTKKLLQAESHHRKQLRLSWYKIIKKYIWVSFAIALVFGIGWGVVETLQPWHIATPIPFYDYTSFKTYMEEEATKPQILVEDGVHIQVEINKYYEEILDNEKLSDDAQAEAETSYADQFPHGSLTVEDSEGNVLCEYPHVTGYRVDFSFDVSDDGLPVYVYTYASIQQARSLLSNIQVACVLAIIADALVCVVLLSIKRYKLYHTSKS